MQATAAFTTFPRLHLRHAKSLTLPSFTLLRADSSHLRIVKHLTRRQARCAASSGRQASSSQEGGRTSTAASSSTAQPTLREQEESNNNHIYDALIDVFQKKTPEEWRKLIAYSKQWPTLAQGVLDRIKEMAAAAEDPEKQTSLRKFHRQLESVHKELEEYKDLIEAFRKAPSPEWESMVIHNRAVMKKQFFAYCQLRVRALYENKPEQEVFHAMVTHLAVTVEAYDQVIADEQGMAAAARKLEAVLEANSLKQAEEKIDFFSSAGKLDPAMLTLLAKGYAEAKQVDFSQNGCMEVMAHLYFHARMKYAQEQPSEVQLLKYAVRMNSASDRENVIRMAFEAGPNHPKDPKYVGTSPEILLNVIRNVLLMYQRTRESATIAGQSGNASEFMHPEAITRLKELRQVIKKKYLEKK